MGIAAAALELLAQRIDSVQQTHTQLTYEVANYDAAHPHADPITRIEGRLQLERQLGSVERTVSGWVQEAADEVSRATKLSSDYSHDPRFNRGAAIRNVLGEFSHQAAELGKGIWHGVADPVESTYQLVRHPSEIESLTKALVEHPGSTLHTMWDRIIDASDWKHDPAKALGEILPTVALTILTFGAAGAASGGADGANAIGKAAAASAAADQALEGAGAAERATDLYSRAQFRTGTREQVWENAKAADGNVYDPLTGRKIDPNEAWDMGHKPGYEFRKAQAFAREQGLSRQDFLNDYNNPTHYRPELPSSNRSHLAEDNSDDYAGTIEFRGK